MAHVPQYVPELTKPPGRLAPAVRATLNASRKHPSESLYNFELDRGGPATETISLDNAFDMDLFNFAD